MMKMYRDDVRSSLTKDAFEAKKIIAVKLAEAYRELDKTGFENWELDYLAYEAIQSFQVYRDIVCGYDLVEDLKRMKYGEEQ